MLRLGFVLSVSVVGLVSFSQAAEAPVGARVESTLATSGERVRQDAFDGDDATSYATEPATAGDHAVALVFDEPVLVKSIEVRTGGDDGAGRVDGGTLEGSADGQAFEKLADFHEGVAKADPKRKLKAVRVVPEKGAEGPLAIREFVVDSDPAVRRFAFPVEVVVDELEAPGMRGWAEKAARECERFYDRINEALRSDGYKPPRIIRMSLKDGIDVPAYAGGDRVTGSVEWFKDHPDDVGAMIHETTHIIQNYRGRRNPGWLVEGVADYVRFVLYEPENIGGLNPQRAKYDDSYRVTARYLDYIVRKYDEDFVLKLNKAMREGKYSDDLFKEATGKTSEELGAEWKASLDK